MLPGRATPEGTAGYFNSRRELGGWLESTGLHCSRIGFGGYRLEGKAVHAEALKTAILSGCNLIDTSTNYTDGESERMVGKALAELVQVGVLDREQIILVSKVGYVQGKTLELAEQRQAQGTPFPEMVQYQQGCWHCIHPEFLETQIQLSMERLGVECIDYYLLHNPEYFLMDAAKRGSNKLLAPLRADFYRRIRQAFEFLETQAEKGRIQGYGVSSNTFGASPARADATSVSAMWEAARALSEEKTGAPDKHHFRVIQLPLNLYECGPYTEKNTGHKATQTALDFASEQGLAVLVNRPLNAFTQQQMVRLADFPQSAIDGTLETLLNELSRQEQEFAGHIAPAIQTAESTVGARDFFRWSRDLGQLKAAAIGSDRWGQIEEQIERQVTSLCDQISTQLTAGPWGEWRGRYLPLLHSVLGCFRNQVNRRSQQTSETVSGSLNPLLPETWRPESLSRKALAVLIHTPGVSCVLNGMRRPDYVHDSMGAVRLSRLSAEEVRRVYAEFRVE